jgi:hypothetical protein
MFWKIKKMLVSSTNIKKYRALFLTTIVAIRLPLSTNLFLIHLKEIK